ncbi:MAG: N-acetyltransferase [Pseudomonadota bacterium]
METSVTTAAAADRERVMQTIMLGFVADPIARWVWPDPDTYLTAMPKFAAAFGGRSFDHQTAYLADDGKAAAMWLPPEIEPDSDAIEAVMAETIPLERGEEIEDFFGQMDEHHPDRPCWYLPLIAADPAFTGRGLGAALMKHALGRCDEDGLMAYLESSNPRNITLYERHGFEVVGEIQAGASPVMTPMVRMPRT